MSSTCNPSYILHKLGLKMSSVAPKPFSEIYYSNEGYQGSVQFKRDFLQTHELTVHDLPTIASDLVLSMLRTGPITEAQTFDEGQEVSLRIEPVSRSSLPYFADKEPITFRIGHQYTTQSDYQFLQSQTTPLFARTKGKTHVKFTVSEDSSDDYTYPFESVSIRKTTTYRTSALLGLWSRYQTLQATQ